MRVGAFGGACVAAALLCTTGPAAPAAVADPATCVPLTIDGTSVACVSQSVSSTDTADSWTHTTVTAALQLYGLPAISRQQTVDSPYVPKSCSWSPQDPTPYADWFTEPVLLSTGVAVYDKPPFVNGDVNREASCIGVALVVFGPAPVVTPPGVGPTQFKQPYHVPEVCLTTTCVGPYDGVIDQTVPFVTTPSVTAHLTVCLESYDYSFATGEPPYTPIACTPVT
jgi:hypothetical protein